uniref:Uncharacterized protein n=1 Tax=Oryza rufipogon TaxID=4529 RepID=A0A0E0QL91_ORYRU
MLAEAVQLLQQQSLPIKLELYSELNEKIDIVPSSKVVFAQMPLSTHGYTLKYYLGPNYPPLLFFLPPTSLALAGGNNATIGSGVGRMATATSTSASSAAAFGAKTPRLGPSPSPISTFARPPLAPRPPAGSTPASTSTARAGVRAPRAVAAGDDVVAAPRPLRLALLLGILLSLAVPLRLLGLRLVPIALPLLLLLVVVVPFTEPLPTRCQGQVTSPASPPPPRYHLLVLRNRLCRQRCNVAASES